MPKKLTDMPTLIKKCKGAIDEIGLTYFATQVFKKVEVVYMRFVVAHAAFGRQYQKDPSIIPKIINLYQNE